MKFWVKGCVKISNKIGGHFGWKFGKIFGKSSAIHEENPKEIWKIRLIFSEMRTYFRKKQGNKSEIQIN